MVIKTFTYELLSDVSSTAKILEKKEISIDVAYKAKYTIHRALKVSTANKAQYTSSTKTKSEVSGGGRKPWKQKGMGRARVGSNRSPLWRGGGVIFGPKPKLLKKKINKKEKRLALRTLLYNKQNQISIFKTFDINELKTANIIQFLINYSFRINQKNLIISSKPNQTLRLMVQNLKNCKYALAAQLNIDLILNANQIFSFRSFFYFF